LSAARAKAFTHRSNQAFGVEDGFVLEHEIDGARQFDRHDGVGFEFVAVHLSLQALGQGADEVVVAFGNDGGFTKGPAQVGVAEFGAAQAFDLAGTPIKPAPSIGNSNFLWEAFGFPFNGPKSRNSDLIYR